MAASWQQRQANGGIQNGQRRHTPVLAATLRANLWGARGLHFTWRLEHPLRQWLLASLQSKQGQGEGDVSVLCWQQARQQNAGGSAGWAVV